MKVKPTSHAGQVVVQLDWQDDPLLEASARLPASSLRLEHLLVPVDFSDRSRQALAEAVAFARPFRSRVSLIHVVEPMVLPENLMLAVPELPEMGGNLVDDCQQRLARLAEQEIPAEQRGRTFVRVGRPFDEICQAATEEQADLIVISTHGYTGLKHVLLGSTAERVVRHAPCPVLTLRAKVPAAGVKPAAA
jgi:universal stress protein A